MKQNVGSSFRVSHLLYVVSNDIRLSFDDRAAENKRREKDILHTF